MVHRTGGGDAEWAGAAARRDAVDQEEAHAADAKNGSCDGSDAASPAVRSRAGGGAAAHYAWTHWQEEVAAAAQRRHRLMRPMTSRQLELRLLEDYEVLIMDSCSVDVVEMLMRLALTAPLLQACPASLFWRTR